MKILQKLAAKQKNVFADSAATIVVFGDSNTQGCFECFMNEQGEIVVTEDIAKRAGEEFVIESKTFNGYNPTEPKTVTMGVEDRTINIYLVKSEMGALAIALIGGGVGAGAVLIIGSIVLIMVFKKKKNNCTFSSYQPHVYLLLFLLKTPPFVLSFQL